MAETNESIEEIVAQIACRILVTDPQFVGVKEDKSKRKMLYEEKINQVIRAIEKSYKNIEKLVPDIQDLPQGLRRIIAVQMLSVIEQNPNAMTNGTIAVEENIVRKINDFKMNDEFKDDTAMKAPSDNKDFIWDKARLDDIVNSVKETGKFETFDGKTIVLEEPSDERMAFPDEESEREEIEILAIENEFAKFYDKCCKGEITQEEYKKSVEGLARSIPIARDALLRFTDGLARKDGAEAVVNNSIGRQTLDVLLDVLKEDRDNKAGIKEDNFTFIYEMDLTDRLHTWFEENNIVNHELKTKIEEVNQKSSKLLNAYPNIMNKLREKYGDKNDPTSIDPQNLAIELGGGPIPITVEQTIENMKEISKDSIEKVKEENERQLDKREEKPKRINSIAVEDIKLNKYENFKRSISNMEKATGREKVYSFVSSTIEKRPEEREELFDAFLDFESASRTSDSLEKDILDMQEKLYRKMLEEEFRNSAIYSKMLDNLLAVPGNSQNVGLIMELSEIKKKIPESHDLVQPIEEYKKENRDDGEEPEGP